MSGARDSAGEAVDERADGDAVAVGEEAVVGAEDEVAGAGFLGDGGWWVSLSAFLFVVEV